MFRNAAKSNRTTALREGSKHTIEQMMQIISEQLN